MTRLLLLSIPFLLLAAGCGSSDAPPPEPPAETPPSEEAAIGQIVRVDPRFDDLVPPGARINR